MEVGNNYSVISKYRLQKFLSKNNKERLIFGKLLFKILSLYWICYSIVSALCFDFFGHEECGILAPQPGIEHALPALEGEVRTTESLGKFHNKLLLKINWYLSGVAPVIFKNYLQNWS